MEFIPCTMCWYQRILMYPLVFIFLVNLLYPDDKLFKYSFSLVVVGLFFSIYHNLLMFKIIPEEAVPCVQGVPCSTIYINWFGFITIPFLSLISFLIIFLLLLIYKKINKRHNMKLFKISLLIFISTFFIACQEEAQTVVKKTPSFQELKEIKNEKTYTLKTTEGKEIKFEYDNKILTSKELNGKIVLLNFFATWCPPCIKEIPVFNKIVKMYPNDFIIISVLFQDPIEMIALKSL